MARFVWPGTDRAGGNEVDGYFLYRSTAAFTAISDSGVVQVGGLLQGLSYVDTSLASGHYYYRLASVHAIANPDGSTSNFPSALSNQADVIIDNTPPAAILTLQPTGSNFDGPNYRLGVGQVQVTVTVSKPLGATPFFSFGVAGAGAIGVNLAAASSTTFTGTFNITANTPSGALSPVISMVDLAGNSGSGITMAAPWKIDTAGPNVTGLTPVQVDSSGNVTLLQPFDVIKMPGGGATLAVSWRLTLDKAPVGGTPTFAATLDNHPNQILTATVVNTIDGNPLTWIATLTLPSDAGAAKAETLTLAYSAADDL